MEKEKDRKKIISIDLDEDEEMMDDDEDETNDSNSEISNVQSEISNPSATASNKRSRKITKALKDILTSNNTKFMSNFDPELSNRERRKLTRKFNNEGKKSNSSTDENGVLNVSEKDVCDCLIEECPGCHFPCPKCRSCKCGVECRTTRKWSYEVVENEAEITNAKNGSIAAS